MAKSFNVKFGEIHLGTEPSGTPAPDPETPFHIALLGNFRGRRNSDSAPRKPIRIDRDNIDDVLAKLGVEVELPPVDSGQAPLSIRFNEMEDFHPDQLFRRLDVFAYLRQMRDKLSNSSTFEEAAKEVERWSSDLTDAETEKPPKQEEPPESKPAPPPDIDPSNLLDQIISESPAEVAAESKPADSSDWSRFMQSIVAKHTVADISDRQEQLTSQVDEAVGSVMRYILHHPDFQAIESTWRSVELLVRRLETDAGLKLFLIDMTKAELAADLKSGELRNTELYKLLVEQTVETPGAARWSVCIGCYTFDRSVEDAWLLGRIAQIAGQGGAPFISAATSHVFACSSIVKTPDPSDWKVSETAEEDEAWQILRKLPESAYIGLAAPRFLLRMPYGRDLSPTDDFAFEEMPDGSVHEQYLWGNSAVLCGLLLGQSFTAQGWGMQPGAISEVNNLPLHIYKEDGESHTKACGEAYLTTTAYEKILDAGVMPFLSVRNRDVVQLARFQSITDPVTRLAGPWQ